MLNIVRDAFVPTGIHQQYTASAVISHTGEEKTQDSRPKTYSVLRINPHVLSCAHIPYPPSCISASLVLSPLSFPPSSKGKARQANGAVHQFSQLTSLGPDTVHHTFPTSHLPPDIFPLSPQRRDPFHDLRGRFPRTSYYRLALPQSMLASHGMGHWGWGWGWDGGSKPVSPLAGGWPELLAFFVSGERCVAVSPFLIIVHRVTSRSTPYTV